MKKKAKAKLGYMSLRIAPADFKELKEHADRERRSVSMMGRILIEEALESRRNRPRQDFAAD